MNALEARAESVKAFDTNIFPGIKGMLTEIARVAKDKTHSLKFYCNVETSPTKFPWSASIDTVIYLKSLLYRVEYHNHNEQTGTLLIDKISW